MSIKSSKLLKLSLLTGVVAVTLSAVANGAVVRVTEASSTVVTDWRKDAAGREVDCELQVKGKTYLKGTCMYDADPDGSFRLMGNKYFVYLNVLDGGVAGASWNETPESSHAQTPLGEDFKRKGACWIGKNAKICAMDKTSAKPQTKPSAVIPIKFARGATSATITGKFSGFDSEQTYSIAVGKGQTMTVEQVKAGNKRTTIWLTEPKGGDASDADLSCNNQKKVSPTIAGTYTIKVSECMKADPWKGSYTLKVTVK